MGTDDELFDGEIPVADVEEAVAKPTRNHANSSQRVRFVFDEFSYKTEKEFVDFTSQF